MSEAEPLDLCYQAEPGNEERAERGARQSLWKCVTRQSLGTRNFCGASKFYSAGSIFGGFSIV